MTIFFLILSYFIAQTLAGALYYLCVPYGADFAEYGYMLLGSYVVLFFLLPLFKLVRKNSMPSWDTQRFKGMIPAAICILLMGLGIELLLKPFALSDEGTMQMFEGMKSNLVCVLLLTVVGPLIEELIFREGILRTLIHRYHVRPLWAVLISALTFGIIHFNLAQCVPAIFLGILLGVLYLLTDDIRLCFVAHVVNNSLALIYLQVPETGSWQDQLPLPLLLGLGALLCALSFYLLKLLLIPHENKKYRFRR